MILPRVLTDGEQEVVMPPGVAVGVGVKDRGDEASYVGDGDGLSVQIEDCSSFVEKHGLSDLGGRGGRSVVGGGGPHIPCAHTLGRQAHGCRWHPAL